MEPPVDVLTVTVSAALSDPQELELLSRQLRRELLELDVEAVENLSEGEVPPGSKGVDLTAVGSLLVHTVTSSAVLTALVNVVQSWVSRQGGRSVKISLEGDSIELTGLSSADQHRLMEHWIASHAVQ